MSGEVRLLADLEPQWFAPPGRRGTGFTFLCPHCRKVRLAVPFAVPLDGRVPVLMGADLIVEHYRSGDEVEKLPFDVPSTFLWGRIGDSFETLSLSPSVDASASGHWHGFVTAGKIITA